MENMLTFNPSLLDATLKSKTTTQGECTCANKVNRELTASLQDCVKATSSLLNCQTTTMEVRRVTREAMKRSVQAEDACECANKVRNALTDSLKFCVEAAENFEDCEASSAAPPTVPVGPPSSPSAPPPPSPPAPAPPPPGFDAELDSIHVNNYPGSSTDPPNNIHVAKNLHSQHHPTNVRKEEALLKEQNEVDLSCQDIKNKHPRSPTGYYNVIINGEKAIVYCKMTEY